MAMRIQFNLIKYDQFFQSFCSGKQLVTAVME